MVAIVLFFDRDTLSEHVGKDGRGSMAGVRPFTPPPILTPLSPTASLRHHLPRPLRPLLYTVIPSSPAKPSDNLSFHSKQSDRFMFRSATDRKNRVTGSISMTQGP